MKTKFWAVIVLQIVVLFSLFGFHYAILLTGTPVLLRTQPVDPRSLFQGQYVELTYEISQLDRSLAAEGSPLRRGSSLYGEKVYVVLSPRGKYWQATSIDSSPPSLAPGSVLLHGWAYADEDQPQIEVKYGIESFFAPESVAPKLEAMGGSGTFDVEVAVSKQGRALIKRVYYNGKPISLRQMLNE